MSDHRMRPDHVRQVVTEWFARRQATTIAFRESVNPASDPYSDYVVIYEAVFEPDTLDQARLEVFATDDGQVAIGFESYQRVAKRLNVANREKTRFAAGHEPYPIAESGLLAVLDLIAGGEIAISTLTIPWYGLAQCAARVRPESFAALVSGGYGTLTWLKVASPRHFAAPGRFQHFRPW